MENDEQEMLVIPNRQPQVRTSALSQDRHCEELILEKTYESASDFLKDVSYGGGVYGTMNRSIVYRGLKSGTYTLVPSVLREKRKLTNPDGTVYVEDEKSPIKIVESELVQRETEYYSLRCFFDICDSNGLKLPDVERIRKSLLSYRDLNARRQFTDDWIPYDLLELTALAQHYGLKTRLLDWTSNIDTAIYFAIHEDPMLSAEESKKPESQFIVIWMLDTGVEYKSKSLKFIRPQYWGNPNLCAQKGLFTYWKEPGFNVPSNIITEDELVKLHKVCINRSPLDMRLKEELAGKRLDHSYMWKLRVPRADKKELWDYINKKGVNAASLFPGYAGVVRSINEAQNLK